MTQEIQFTMPVEREEQYENERGSYNSTVSLYKPLPIKAGERFVNELFIPLFDPASWSIFNKSPEERERLGLVESNPLAPISAEEVPLYSFYFKVPVHFIQNFVRGDGSSGFTRLICPRHFNAYLEKALGRRPLFKDSKCSICDAAQRAWGDHNERWKQVEEERDIKKNKLNVEGFRELRDKDPILKETYKRAKEFEVKEQIISNVFDIGKLRGTRPLEVENESLTYQIYFVPKTVFQHLREQWVEDTKEGQLGFYSFYNPQGLQIMKLIKSTENCRGSNMRDTDYSVMKGSVVALDPAWLTYLRSLERMIDPSDLLNIASYDNMALYAHSEDETSYNRPATTTSQAPSTSKVERPAALPPQAAPPQAAPPQAAPPQAAPPQVAPQVPPQIPPQVPSAPPAYSSPQAAPQVPPQVPSQAAPQIMDSAVPPIVSGAAPTVSSIGAQGAPTLPEGTLPDRRPPQIPPGSNFSW